MSNPRFLIANNPFPNGEETAEFILHNYRPRFLAKVEQLDFEELEQQSEKPFCDVLYISAEGVMEIYRIEIAEFYDKADDDTFTDLLFRSNSFYVKYLQELDNEEGGKPGFPVKDFSKELPGLKILHAPDRWTVVYNGMVADFTEEEEMDAFLESELGITADLLDKGVINQFN